MRQLVYYVGVSIDGYIAGPGGEVDFYPLADDMAAWIFERYPETIPSHIRPRVGLRGVPNKQFDTVLMGLGTYRPGLEIDVTSPYPHLRQYVVSNTLDEIADPSVELVADNPLGLVRDLKAEDGEMDIWLAGGGKLAASVLDEIDELIVKSYPVAAGDGVSAFRGEFMPTHFVPTQHESFSNGATVTWYARK